ncbi:MAG: hypothetical protein LPK28_06115 [Bacteroidota bacterium]|nr:hypothetical protein [Bacteroidota bacterium]
MIDDFFDSIPGILTPLGPDTKPKWGSMTSAEMLDHLITGLHLGMSKEEFEITTPEDKIPKFQAFLMSDRPLVKMADMPEPYVRFKSQDPGDLEDLKEKLIHDLRRFREKMDDPDHFSVHPIFGKLNNEATRMLHYKHLRHHLTQFGLIPEDNPAANG